MTRVVPDLGAVRRRFSSLQGEFTFLDAPGGSQVPDEVGDAMARCLREASANIGAPYETSRRVGAILDGAEQRSARFLGCEPHEIVFGTNMTSLNFALSRTAGRGFQAGDEILVSSLDHDGGVAPWLELAHDRDLVVRHVELNDDTTLDFDDLRAKLSDRTRVVAFAWASNAIGTITDARRVCALAHSVGALAWIDAVHYAAHEPIDVRAVDADVLLCSPYKFCGPHLGLAYGKAEVIERWRPYKARPAATTPLGRRFETGTMPYELLAGLNTTFDYLDDIGGFEVIVPHERALGERFLAALPDAARVYGLQTMEGRVPTFLVNLDGVPAPQVAGRLADRGMGVWAHDSWYSLNLYERFGYGSDGSVRIGFIHYNTADEVDRLAGELTQIAASA
ncbi:cysteine desulfurase-like protein [Candidatus Solirubrobacter pratensis]|jgi:cysteine desulfurase family protein (TIGR01976 family)|uniref:cysteine desulfurase-like protein n=1 Tax=Candidatus Solirubrobacter pratensis TaxID=1298857 RepID=UPI0003F66725|nr:cysteine desulfurase-like protein [Candidatus Solirubrobacter pratensis]